MNIAVDTKTVIRDHQCISCLECTSEAVCPVARTVTFSASLPVLPLRVKNDPYI